MPLSAIFQLYHDDQL